MDPDLERMRLWEDRPVRTRLRDFSSRLNRWRVHPDDNRHLAGSAQHGRDTSNFIAPFRTGSPVRIGPCLPLAVTGDMPTAESVEKRRPTPPFIGEFFAVCLTTSQRFLAVRDTLRSKFRKLGCSNPRFAMAG